MKKLALVAIFLLAGCAKYNPEYKVITTEAYVVAESSDGDTPVICLSFAPVSRIFALGKPFHYTNGIELPDDILHREVVVTIKECVKYCKNDYISDVLSISRKRFL